MKKLLPALSVCAALAWPLAAHALDETPLSMVFEGPSQAYPTTSGSPKAAPPSLPRVTGCQLAPLALQDLRPHKDTVGAAIFMIEAQPAAVPLQAVSLRSGDGLAWLKGAATAIGLPAKDAAGNAAEGLQLALRHAQTWTGGLNIHAHVVLQANYPGAGGTRTERRYHGFATKLNGWGANSEFMTTLNLAMQDALVQLGPDLRRACGGETL